MALYEDIQKVGATKQFPNSRFRTEFIRSNMQNPGGFYKQFGADLTNPMGGTQSFNQPLEQLQTLPGTSGLGDLFSSGTGNGTGRGFDGDYSGTYGPQTNRTATGGLLGNSPAMGGLIGTGLGMAGVPMSGFIGQTLSGTPESQKQAGIGTALGMATNALGLNKYSGLLGMGVNALQGQTPSMEQVAMTAAYMNPATAPFAAAYGLGKNLASLNDERMARNYAEDQKYGLTGTRLTGAPTTMGALGNMFGIGYDPVQNDQGLANNLTANTLGFNPVGMMGYATPSEFGLSKEAMDAAMGISQPNLSMQGALSSLYGIPSEPSYNPADFGYGGDTGPGVTTSPVTGYGPITETDLGYLGAGGLGSNSDSDGSAGSTNPGGGGISGYGGGTY